MSLHKAAAQVLRGLASRPARVGLQCTGGSLRQSSSAGWVQGHAAKVAVLWTFGFAMTEQFVPVIVHWLEDLMTRDQLSSSRFFWKKGLALYTYESPVD
ncbi:hypothetical protein PG993_013383 [Apiospora rasikravindrae]|uniref:Uncharacterized protein n=1 Tax=Apiospora rasikravindrae TaxID=990691 RepID=A0ABR1RXH2_9PEZI